MYQRGGATDKWRKYLPPPEVLGAGTSFLRNQPTAAGGVPFCEHECCLRAAAGVGDQRHLTTVRSASVDMAERGGAGMSGRTPDSRSDDRVTEALSVSFWGFIT